MKAIETRYRGCRFRSRLEARWAVFFDALKIRWEYELEGYVLNDGTWYLPDFWLPTFAGGMFVEVKPPGESFDKAKQFCKDSGKSIWLAEGTPDVRAYIVADPLPDEGNPPIPPEAVVWEWPGIPNADQAEGENRMFSYPGYENEDLSISPACWGMLGATFLNAVEKARGARFEHDERERNQLHRQMDEKLAAARRQYDQHGLTAEF